MNLMLLIHGTNSVNHMLRDIVERLILQETSIKFVHHRNLFLDSFALMPCSLPDKQTTYERKYLLPTMHVSITELL